MEQMPEPLLEKADLIRPMLVKGKIFNLRESLSENLENVGQTEDTQSTQLLLSIIKDRFWIAV